MALKGGATNFGKNTDSALISMRHLVVKFWTKSLTYLLVQIQGAEELLVEDVPEIHLVI